MKEINPEKIIGKYPNDIQKQIEYLEKKGFVVERQKETVAKLVKTKKYKPMLAIILFILGVLPGVLYTLHFLKYRKHVIVLDVEGQEE